jgi:hypothetical protein
MTEADWLSGKYPDEMLDAVADRLSARRWRLLGAALIRRLRELLPPGILRDAVDFAERSDALALADITAWREQVALATEPAVAQARAELQDQVRKVEMASDDDLDGDATYPSEVLHRAAVGYARGAAHTAGEAVTYAADAVQLLFAPPGPETFDQLLTAVREADALWVLARQNVVNAHKLAAEGDRFADEYNALNPKKARLAMSRAEGIVSKLERTDGGDAADLREKTYNRLLARTLHELVGNPFQEYRFDSRWRTETVLVLARTIREERAFDRMPILADALLDADCDEEAVLRHCRGTEKHTPDKPQHLRGCWVLDLILAPDDPVFTAGPLAATKRKPRGDWWD